MNDFSQKKIRILLQIVVECQLRGFHGNNSIIANVCVTGEHV